MDVKIRAGKNTANLGKREDQALFNFEGMHNDVGQAVEDEDRIGHLFRKARPEVMRRDGTKEERLKMEIIEMENEC